jgi:hypothetical protein
MRFPAHSDEDHGVRDIDVFRSRARGTASGSIKLGNARQAIVNAQRDIPNECGRMRQVFESDPDIGYRFIRGLKARIPHELAELALDPLSLGVDCLFERIFHGARQVIRNDDLRASCGDGAAQTLESQAVSTTMMSAARPSMSATTCGVRSDPWRSFGWTMRGPQTLDGAQPARLLGFEGGAIQAPITRRYPVQSKNRGNPAKSERRWLIVYD